MIVVNLAPWPIQPAVVVKRLEAAQNLPSAAGDQPQQVRRTQKPVSPNKPDDFPVP